MTVLVFTSGILTIATETWTATALRDAAKPSVQIHVLGSPVKAQGNLDMDMAEFLALIADGGRVIDLRGLQAPVEPSRREIAERLMQRPRPAGTEDFV